jgi:lactonase family protein with 7-bladed beta-propeller
MKSRHLPLREAAISLAILTLAACGGDGSSSGSGPPHTIGGTISGLKGSGLALRDNGGGTLDISGNGNFTFPAAVAAGNPFNVTVSTQPTNPSQTCMVAHGSGTVSGDDITNVAVTCTTNSFTVGGTVSGLAGSGLVLADNGGNDTAVSSNGPFTFTTTLASGSAFSVSVATQPTNPPQTCAVANASGTLAAGNISTVSVTCATNTYSVGGYVSGLAGSGFALRYNGGAAIPVTRNGGFIAAGGLAIGTTYGVTIVAQPTNPAQTCVLSNGSGAVGTANVASIMVFCPQAVARFAYVVGAGSEPPNTNATLGTISVFIIDPVSGALTSISGSTVPTGPEVSSFQFVPHSSFAWALDEGVEYPLNLSGLGSIYDYSVDATTGLLTAVNGSPFSQLDGTSTTPGCASPPNAPSPTGLGSTGFVTFSPAGAFGVAQNFAADSFGNPAMNANAQTWLFTVDSANGAPSLVPGSSIAQACGADGYTSATIDPSGQFLYVPGGAAPLYAYSIDPVSHALTEAPGSPYQIFSTPVIDPSGRFAYGYNANRQLYGYSIDPSSGALTQIPGGPYTAVSASIAIAPNGKFAYLSESNGIYVYSINATTGALTATGSSVPQAATRMPLQIDPSGQFAYAVAGSGSGLQTGVYAYTINTATGALTPLPGNPFAPSSGIGAPVTITLSP